MAEQTWTSQNQKTSKQSSIQSDSRKSSGVVLQDNRTSTPIAQLVTYKGVEYSRSLNNLADFHQQAGQDLDDQKPHRDKSRDKKMLNVIGNSDKVITSPEELANKVYPHNKGYQHSIEQDLNKVDPYIGNILGAARNTYGIAPEVVTDGSYQTHLMINGDMKVVKDNNAKVEEVIQWKKLGGVNTNADRIIKVTGDTKTILEEQASASMTEAQTSEPPSKNELKRLAKAKQRQKKVMDSAVDTIQESAGQIIDTERSIPQELHSSADEQYLRGTVGAKDSVGGGSHLNIGKKTETKPIMDTNPEEGRGVLWASMWSHGVNSAFIEGGSDESHTFKLISKLPEPLRAPLQAGNIEVFKQTAKLGAKQEWTQDGEQFKDGPWSGYYHVSNDDWTTLSKEIIQLLHAGYVLQR